MSNPLDPPKIIAFTGPKSSGKDTAARHLLARNSIEKRLMFQQYNFADPLKAACGDIFGLTKQEMNDLPYKEEPLTRWPYGVPREHLITVAKMFRDKYGGDVFARRWEEIITAPTMDAVCVLVTDLRHPEELDVLARLNAYIFYIQNDEAERKLDHLRHNGDMAANDQSEAHYKLLRSRANAIIPNNAGLPELHDYTAKVTKALLGDWAQWPTTR